MIKGEELKGLAGKKIVVTGGAGFIGAKLVKRLVELGARPTAVYLHALNERRLSGAAYIKANLVKPGEVKKVFAEVKGPEFIVHLAAAIPPLGGGLGDTLASIDANLTSTINILNHLPKTVRQFIFASTLDVYGNPVFLPMTEQHPTNPVTYYGAGKLASEKFLQIFFNDKKIPLTILRFSHVYGPGEKKIKVIPLFMDCILNGRRPVLYGEGEEVRDYVYVADVVNAVILSIKKRASGIFNIATGRGNSLKEVLRLMSKITKKDIAPIYRPRKKEFVKLIFDISRARKELNYSPRYNLYEGLR
ncbi:MAG: NAD-dependent epimerase/dehydratase family protein, partial [Candidatus Omnitrophica bacterium]|nr:NAD-dependent epimerase/dehydratase family protein [Candidatus Omnitrophota bacterium]